MDPTLPNEETAEATVSDARGRYPSARPPEPLSADCTKALIRLSNVQFPPRMLTNLLIHFNWLPESIFEAADIEFDDVPGFLARQLVRLRDPNLQATDRQIQWMEKTSSQILLANRSDYPQLLLEIPDAPAMLFVRGKLSDVDASSVGIVGSRNATPYGKTVAGQLARELAENGVTVVSGGAAGIDTAAHRGALEGGGRTVAVLGCGLDVDYPKENWQLFEDIANSGAVISEYALGSQPDSFRFPQRNRLISGLSLGTLVIEAPRQSGSLITSRYASEQGRTVLTVPANIDRPNSLGSNDLLKDGAVPVTEVGDILLALRLVAVPARREDQRALNFNFDAEPEGQPGKSAASGKSAKSMKSLSRIIQDLTENQKRLVLQLTETPKHIDTIASEADLNAVTAGVEMTMLELAGVVRRLPGNTYILAVG